MDLLFNQLARPMRSYVALAVAVAAIAFLSSPPVKHPRGEHLPPMLPRKEFAYALGKSQLMLFSDYLWIQTGHAVGAARYRDEFLDPYYYADLLTDLDPDFGFVYLFAGISVPYNLGRETWINTHESTQLFEKGYRRFPTFLQLAIALAYNLSYYHQEYQRAAGIIERAAKLPGAPSYLASLATRLYSQSGDFDAGLALAQSMRDSATNPEDRAVFEQRVKELLLERVLTRIEKACKAFSTRAGRPPQNISELVETQDLEAAPSDPLGGRLELNAECTARATSQARRLRPYGFKEDSEP